MARSVLIISPHLRQDGAIGALRVNHFVESLRHDGWSVTAVGRTPGTHADDIAIVDPTQTVREYIGERASGRGTGRLIAALLFRLFPDEQILWVLRVVKVMRAHQYDIVFVSGPPFSVFIGTAYLADRSDTPLVLDYRDLWTLGGYYDHGRLRKKVERHLESWVWRKSVAAISVSEPLVTELARHVGGLRTAVVRNGYDPKMYDRFNYQKSSDRSARFVLSHLGQLYPGRRDPSPLFEALAGDVGLQQDVTLQFYGSNANTLKPLVRKWRLEGCVELKNKLSLGETLKVQEESDALLLLLWNDPREEGVYSGKLFEYLASRRPILMLGYENGVASALIQERHAGIVANDPESLRRTLAEWVATKRCGARRNNEANVAHGLDREAQVQELKQILLHSIRS